MNYIYLEMSCIHLHIGDVSINICSIFNQIFTFLVPNLKRAVFSRTESMHYTGSIQNSHQGAWVMVQQFDLLSCSLIGWSNASPAPSGMSTNQSARN